MTSPFDDANFEARIAASSKPVLVCFTSTFCGPSHALFPVLDDMLDGREDFNYAELDVESCPLMTRKFEVKGTPTLIWFKNGEPIGSRAGTMSDRFLGEFIDKMTA